MKCAAVCILVCLALKSPAFALLRPLFPVKAAPPFSSGAIVTGDDLVSPGSAKEARITPRRLGYARFYSRSHDGLIRVYDEAGDVIETQEHKSDFKEW